MKAGRELDALVAEHVMGFKKVTEIVVDYEPPHELYRAPDGRGYYPNKIPSYSTDIAAAWQVVEKVKESRQSFVLTCLWGGPYIAEWDGGGTVEGRYVVNACAATVPLAICLAALKAVGVEVEE